MPAPLCSLPGLVSNINHANIVASHFLFKIKELKIFKILDIAIF